MIKHDFLIVREVLQTSYGFLEFVVFLQRGFVEAHADDGLLEIFGLKQGWHASFVMVELIAAKHITQVLLLDASINLFISRIATPTN